MHSYLPVCTHPQVHTGLSASLLKVPPGVLDAAIKAVTQGAGVHVDALVRRSCMQVRPQMGRVLWGWHTSSLLLPN